MLGDRAAGNGGTCCRGPSCAACWPATAGVADVQGVGRRPRFGLLGAVLGVTVWRLANLDPAFGWSGGLTGVVLCGLLSLLLFRPCVITYTSLQGATMLVFGALVLVLKHDDMGPSLAGQMDGKPLLLPMLDVSCRRWSATSTSSRCRPPPPRPSRPARRRRRLRNDRHRTRRAGSAKLRRRGWNHRCTPMHTGKSVADAPPDRCASVSIGGSNLFVFVRA